MTEQMARREFPLTSMVTTEAVCPPGYGPPLERAAAHSSPDSDFELDVQVVDYLSGSTVAGILEDFTPGEVTVSLNEPISEHRTVTVRLSSFFFKGETLYCRPTQAGYKTHISIDDASETGLRRVPRFPVKLPGHLFLPHTGPVAITIVDISCDGLGIELPLSVNAGQPIGLATESVFIFAIVHHCRQLSQGLFRAGVEMHHLFEKSVEFSTESPHSGLLGWVWGKRLTKKTQ